MIKDLANNVKVMLNEISKLNDSIDEKMNLIDRTISIGDRVKIITKVDIEGTKHKFVSKESFEVEMVLNTADEDYILYKVKNFKKYYKQSELMKVR
jgi:hypothetical protein